MNLNNVKGMDITTYTEEEIREKLSDEDLAEFLTLLGYDKED